VRIDSGVANAAMTSPLMFAGGRLRAFFYDSTVGRLNSVYTAESTDSGATWGNERMLLDGPAAGRDYNEPVSVRFPRGRLVLFFRWGMHSGIGRLESRDNGATWSHLSRVVRGVSGRPSLTRLASGLLVMAGRLTTGNRASVILTSRDAGLTWPSRQVLDVPGQLATYAAPVEVSPGVVCCPFGSQDSGTEASLMVRYLGMPGTVTPFREVIGS